jgi:hypothetical protein
MMMISLITRMGRKGKKSLKNVYLIYSSGNKNVEGQQLEIETWLYAL